MAALVVKHGEELGRDKIPVPRIVLDEHAYRSTWRKLAEFGGYALAELYRNMVDSAVAYSEGGYGYRLPWRTYGEIRAFCMTRGFDPELMDVLFATTILDLPRGGRAAIVYAEPAYKGPVRMVRERKRRMVREPVAQ